MNPLAVFFLLAVSVIAQSAWPVRTSDAEVPPYATSAPPYSSSPYSSSPYSSSPYSSSPYSSSPYASSPYPSSYYSSPSPYSSSHHPVMPTTTAADPPYVTSALGNHTAPTWSYYATTVTTVVVVQSLTTKCEQATTLTFNDCEYPATAGQVVVVTNCPCTVTTTIATMTSSLNAPTQTASPVPPHATTTTMSKPASPPGSTVSPSMVHVGGASLAESVDLKALVVVVALALGL
ncbi:hypothetical protein GGS21DRAFT_546208 [Xylaria nigripes]|nr:hypothetical protein GGS21DRAFT_546208 [Xylaria nigripes]